MKAPAVKAPALKAPRRARGVLAALAALAVTGAVLAGCSGGGGGTISATAVFSDVNDLVAGAPVQFADISVGNVQSISLAHNDAKVVMTIDRSANVPADVTAEIQQTTILGEHFVALVPGGGGGQPLADNAVINKTEFVPGIQQLVSAGSEVFGAINAAQLSEIVINGAQGFGGQSAQISSLLDNFDTVLRGYASRSAEIKSVIEQVDQFASTLAPDAQTDAQALTNLAQTTTVLAQESGQFEQLLQSLDNLAVQGRSILDTGVPQTEDQINALSAVANQLAQHQQDLATLLVSLPGHNAALSSLTVNNYAQILEDIIVCGIPGGGSNSSQADATCGPGGLP